MKTRVKFISKFLDEFANDLRLQFIIKVQLFLNYINFHESIPHYFVILLVYLNPLKIVVVFSREKEIKNKQINKKNRYSVVRIDFGQTDELLKIYYLNLNSSRLLSYMYANNFFLTEFTNDHSL